MTTITVEIDKERDLSAIQALLSSLGLKYHIADNEWGDLSHAEIEGIKAGLEDIDAGRTYSNEYVIDEMNKKITQFRKNNAR